MDSDSSDGAARSFPQTLFLPLWLVLGLMLYFLSIGPIAWLSERDLLSPDVEWFLEEAIYLPMAYFYERWEPFQAICDFYTAFWRG
jgi:hypothetical protein